jgi:hypothetical protein
VADSANSRCNFQEAAASGKSRPRVAGHERPVSGDPISFARLKRRTHPDKTSVGRIEKGFDFLGYHFSRGPIRLAHQSVQHFLARLHRLYEQQKKAPEGALILGKYVTRWLRWTRAGLWELDRGCLPSTPTRKPESS